MGLLSSTKQVLYYATVTIGTVVVGVTVNAYILYLLRKDIKSLESEIVALRTQLLGNQPRDSSRGFTRDGSESGSEDDFLLALESVPSQSVPIRCTDQDTPLLELCVDIDTRHDELKRTEEGCGRSVEELRELEGKYPNTPQLKWRLARVMFEKTKHEARRGGDVREQLTQAMLVAKQGVELSSNNSKSHLWYAILLGDTSKYDDTKTKLIKGKEFEEQVKISLDINPRNATALHLIGRYCFEVAGITWWEAKIASALFGTVPVSSYDEALEYFLKAYEINTEWNENTLFIVKCLVALNRKQEAKAWIEKIKLDDAEKEIATQIQELSRSVLGSHG